MKHTIVLATILLPGALPAQSFSVPNAGFFRDARGGAVLMKGLSGAFIPGAAASADNLNIAFSGVCGIRKTSSRILFFDATGADIAGWNAPAGPALFAFDTNGSPAGAWLSETRQALLWSGPAGRGPSSIVPRLAEGWQVRAIAVTRSRAVVRLLADDGQRLFSVQFLARSGDVVEVNPIGPSTPAAWLAADGAIAWFDAAQGMLVLRETEGKERRFAMDDVPESIYQAGAGWLAVTGASGAVSAVRLDSSDPRILTLPFSEVEK